MNSTNPTNTMNPFKSSHTIIISDIGRILACAHRYKDAFRVLKNFEQDMFVYFNLHSSEFYDQLSEKHQDDSKALKRIEFLRNDTVDCKVQFLAFMDRYPANVNQIRARNFGREFCVFSQRILERIATEEAVLFPILEI